MLMGKERNVVGTNHWHHSVKRCMVERVVGMDQMGRSCTVSRQSKVLSKKSISHE